MSQTGWKDVNDRVEVAKLLKAVVSREQFCKAEETDEERKMIKWKGMEM